jgi:probable HAF family extracellular repeat protein
MTLLPPFTLKRNIALCGVLVWGAVFLIDASARAELFSVIDVGTINGGVNMATGINDAGQVVVDITTPGSESAYVYSNGTKTGLGTPGTSIYATAINNAGQVAGLSPTTAGTQQAFIYSNGMMTSLGTLGGTE